LKFKVDENLPTEYASILRGAGFDADTVSDEKLSGASAKNDAPRPRASILIRARSVVQVHPGPP